MPSSQISVSGKNAIPSKSQMVLFFYIIFMDIHTWFAFWSSREYFTVVPIRYHMIDDNQILHYCLFCSYPLLFATYSNTKICSCILYDKYLGKCTFHLCHLHPSCILPLLILPYIMNSDLFCLMCSAFYMGHYYKNSLNKSINAPSLHYSKCLLSLSWNLIKHVCTCPGIALRVLASLVFYQAIFYQPKNDSIASSPVPFQNVNKGFCSCTFSKVGLNETCI